MATGGEKQVGDGTADAKAPTPQETTDDALIDDQYFMGVALLSSHRSKDPNTKVGACIVNHTKQCIVGVGYNGMPDRGMVHNDGKFSWGRESKVKTENKHLYVCHAEMNAIVNKICADIQDCTIYTTLYPCKECSKLMVQFGIKKVVYFEDKYPDRTDTKESKDLLKRYEITTEKYEPKGNLKRRFRALREL